MAENDQIVTRYMEDKEFQSSAFPILAREIFDAVRLQRSDDFSMKVVLQDEGGRSH